MYERHFCALENETYATVSLASMGHERTAGIVGRNEVVGTLGRCVDALLIKKPLRKCQIIGRLNFGEKMSNSSRYTEVLGMIQSKEIDAFLRGEPDYLHEEWLAKSVTIQMEQILVGHVIRDRVDSFNLLDNFNIGLTLTIVALFLAFGVLALSFLFNELADLVRFGKRRARRVHKRIVRAVRSFGVTELSAIGLFVLFTNLFLWMIELFLTNNIKTNTVVVDTSQLLQDAHDIFRTKRTACMLNDQLKGMIASSPNQKSVLSRILRDKTWLPPEMVEERGIAKGARCLLAKSPKIFSLVRSPGIFFIAEKNVANFLFTIPYLIKGVTKKMWLSEKSLWEYNLAIYHQKGKPRVASMTQSYTEVGLVNRMYGCIANAAKESFRNDEVNLFQKLDDYTEQYSGFSDLVFANFRFIFIFLFLFCSLPSLAFCLHHLVNWPRNKQRNGKKF